MKRKPKHRVNGRKVVSNRNKVLSLVAAPPAPEGMAYRVTGDDFTMLSNHGGIATIAARAISRETGKQTHVMLGNNVILSGQVEAPRRGRGRPRSVPA